MEKEFIPYEQALALKELGFNESCLATIDQTEYIHINGTKETSIRGAMVYNEIPVPLYQQAFKWFRDKHNLVSYIEPIWGNINYWYSYSFKNILNDYTFYYSAFKTYEEAELACLKKLIEIVKNK